MATSMLNVYDLSRRKTAVLQNAYSIQETKELNQIYHLDFNLPATDEKAKYIQAFHYVRYGEDGELYRIVSAKQSESDTSTLTVSCEHVIATLVDDLIFGVFQYGGGTIKTGDVITALLAKQNTKNWILDECDFTRRFEYLWEQENILNALYSIPKEFTKAYKWCFDTTGYPWKVSLKAIDTTIHPEYYIRAKSNLLGSDAQQDFTGICTRIYPLGYGEGVNQLGIKEINDGKTYLEAPAEVIARYGIKEKVLVDRRYENAKSLMAYGQTVLDALSVPSLTRSFNVIDLYPITGAEIDNAQPGQIAKLTEDGTVTYITKTTRVLDKPGNLQIDLSTKATDIASSIADLAERVRIEAIYAQGATQLYQHSKDANATPSKGMVLSLYFPSEMKQINKVLLRLKLGKFRSYSQTTSAGGGSTATSSSGGGSTTTSSSGGGSTVTSSSGGGTGSTSAATGSSTISGKATTEAIWEYGYANPTTTTAYTNEVTVDTSDGYRYSYENGSGYTDTPYPYSGGDGHYHGFYKPYHHYHRITGLKIAIPTLSIPLGQFKHNHAINITASQNFGSHSHSFSLGTHNHNVNIPAHTHTTTIPNHTHELDIPSHSHKIDAGIFESGNPTSFDIFIGGEKQTTVNNISYDGDITEWLLNIDNQIPRGQWIDIEIRPNDLAYVQSSVFIQGFVQSRGGGNY